MLIKLLDAIVKLPGDILSGGGVMRAGVLRIRELVYERLRPSYNDFSVGEEEGGECCQQCVGG